MVTVDRLRLDGFGRFQEQEFTLSPGLNVVLGGNEAGKSTIHSFIEAMLFGFWKPNVPNLEPEQGREKYRPWRWQNYGGEMDYSWQGGRIRVIRNFAENTVALFDPRTGKEIEGLPLNSWGDPDFARLHFNCSKLVFRNTISISQLGSATDTAVASEVRNLLSNLVQSGGSGISVEVALAALEKAMRQTDFELMKSRAILEQLHNRLTEAQEQTQEAARLEIKQYQTGRELDSLSQERRHLKESAQKMQARVAYNKVVRIERLRQRLDLIKVQLTELASASVGPETYEQWTALQAAIEKTRELHRIHDDALAETVERKQQLQEQILGLGPYQNFDKDTLIEMSSAWQMQVKGQQVIEELQIQLDGIGNEIRATTNELSKLPYFRPDTLEQASTLQVQVRGGIIQEPQEDVALDLERQERKLEILRSLRWILFLILPLAGAAAWFIQPVFAGPIIPALLGIFASQGRIKKVNLRCRSLRRELYTLEMDYLNSQRQREKAQRELEGLLSRSKVDSIRELEERYHTFMRLSEQNRDLLREQKYIADKIADYSQESGDKSRELTSILKKVGLDNMTLEQALACFRVNLDKLLDTRMILEQCQEQEESARHRREQSSRELAELEDQAQRIMKTYSVDSPQQFATRASEYGQRQELTAEEETVKQRILDILEGSDETQLREQAAAASDVLNSDNAKDFPQCLEALDEQILQLQARKSEGLGRLEGLYSDLPSTAELEEEGWQLEDHCQWLELNLQAIDLAKKTIAQLAEEFNSQLAPELNHMVSSLVHRITGGKYNELQVAKDMSINVLTPEQDNHVDLSLLSGGTIDQFYFACRVAIADLLTGGGLPLFLDDSFVQYDDQRLRHMLKLLVELGSSRQIILLTCQQRELEALANLAPGQYQAICLE